MNRMTENDILFGDIEWYGIDKKGNVAVFCNAGKASVPEFVCENKERVEHLVDLFEKMPSISKTKLCFTPCEKNRRKEVAEEFSNKGLYYYDSDDCSEINYSILQTYYTINSVPTNPIKFDDLPFKIQELIQFNKVNVDDFANVKTIDVTIY